MINPDYAAKYAQEWERLKKENPRPVILVSGATGAGKSTLINLVLGKEVAKTGAGRPITMNMEMFENDMIVLYDSKGYENGEQAQKEFFEDIRNFLVQKQAAPATTVTIAWHCVSAPAARFLDVDAKLLTLYTEFKIPAALVLTQVDCADQGQIDALSAIAKESFGSLEVFLSTTDLELAKSLPHNLEALYKWSRKRMGIARRAAFVAACNRDLDEKRIKGHKIAAKHATAAFAAGFAPIPFSDAPLMIANQMGMVAKIGYLWGMNLQGLLAGGALGQAMAVLGKSAAANLLKFFPGIGTLAGGMINGAVGAGFTYALGGALNEICRQVCVKQVNGEPVFYEQLFSAESLIEAMQEIIKGYNGKKPWENEALE